MKEKQFQFQMKGEDRVQDGSKQKGLFNLPSHLLSPPGVHLPSAEIDHYSLLSPFHQNSLLKNLENQLS